MITPRELVRRWAPGPGIPEPEVFTKRAQQTLRYAIRPLEWAVLVYGVAVPLALVASAIDPRTTPAVTVVLVAWFFALVLRFGLKVLARMIHEAPEMSHEGDQTR